MPFFDAGDAAIYYELSGNGPPLILLHGYALNGLMWEYQIGEFARQRTVITVDLRGFGLSSCGKEWSTVLMASDVMDLVQSLSLKDVAVLGFSMGGPVAMRIAYLLSRYVKTLILVSSVLPTRGNEKTKQQQRLEEMELETLKTKGVFGWADSIGMWHGPLIGNMFWQNPETESLWRRLLARHEYNHISCMLTGRLSSRPEADWRARLREISQETLVVAGEADKNFIAASKLLAIEIPNSKLEIIKNAGHMVNLENVTVFNKNVLDFLEAQRD